MREIDELIEAFMIFKKYLKPEDSWYLSAEHDIIYSNTSLEIIPKSSEDGKKLYKLGWHGEDGIWAKHT